MNIKKERDRLDYADGMSRSHSWVIDLLAIIALVLAFMVGVLVCSFI